MKKTLVALTVLGLGFSAVSHAAVVSDPSIATWKATAKKDTTSALVVTALDSSVAFQYAEGIQGFNTASSLFDVAIRGDATATDFTLKAKKLSGTLNHLAAQSTLDVGVLWSGEPLSTSAYTMIIDTANGITGGTLSPIASGMLGDATAQGSMGFRIESATNNGTASDFSALPDGLWTGDVNVEFIAEWI